MMSPETTRRVQQIESELKDLDAKKQELLQRVGEDPSQAKTDMVALMQSMDGLIKELVSLIDLESESIKTIN